MSKPNFFQLIIAAFELRDKQAKHHTFCPNHISKAVIMASKKLTSTAQKAKPAAAAAATKKAQPKPAKRAPAAKKDTSKPGQYSMHQDAT